MPRRTLTAETIGRIKPTATRREIADALVPGLYLIVQPSGSRSFAVRTRVAGKPVKLTLGPWPVIDLARARELARIKLQTAGTGIDPRQAEREAVREAEQAAGRTVEAVAADWLRRDQGDNRGVAEVARIMAREVLPYIGQMQIESVRKCDLLAVIDRVVDRAPVRANRVLAHTRRLFKWACIRDLIEFSPAANIERPTVERSRDRVLSDAELVTIWHAAGRVGGAYGAGVKLLMLSGARMSEVMEARWSEVEGGAIRLPAARSKSGESRVIPLSPPALEILGALPRFVGCDWVLSVAGRGPVRGLSVAKARLDRELADAALSSWRHHDLRRTLATGMQRLGVRLEVIETVLGHVNGSRAGIVGTYQKYRFETEAADAVRRWGDHITTLLGGGPAKVIELRRLGVK